MYNGEHWVSDAVLIRKQREREKERERESEGGREGGREGVREGGREREREGALRHPLVPYETFRGYIYTPSIPAGKPQLFCSFA